MHHLHWRGDILSVYAIAGFGLLLFANAPNRLILVVGILLVLNIPARLQDAYMALNHIDTGAMWGQIFDEPGNKRYLQLIREGNYLPFVLDNLAVFPKKMQFQLLSGRIYITFGFFLLGFWFARKRLLQNFQSERPFFKKILMYTLVIVLVLVAVAVVIQVSGVFNNKIQPPLWLNALFSTLFDLLNASTVLFYVAGISFLFSKKSWHDILESTAVIGKIALTSYLTQTLLAWFIFFGFGFDLLGRVSPAVGYLIGIGVFLGQIVFSKFWLSRFYYGPVKWAWRSLTYLKAQPFVR
ncbi:DUF418 domain-containing protein [Runella sp.]|uniref:DUF418 domain-containing protein n=1 Tax=Runella sp. TaxID=1960881 RepID=UPI0030173F79